jgi:hypothetical protein
MRSRGAVQNISEMSFKPLLRIMRRRMTGHGKLREIEKGGRDERTESFIIMDQSTWSVILLVFRWYLEA